MSVAERHVIAAATPDLPAAGGTHADASFPWQLHPARQPAPAPSLDYAIAARGYTAGFNRAARLYSIPLRAQTRRVDGYTYRSYALAAQPAADLAQAARHVRQHLAAAALDLGKRWERVYLPEIERHLAYWRSFDLEGASVAQLIAHFDETVRRLDRLWAIYYEVGLPMALAPALLAELYISLFGEQREQEVAVLLQGLDSMPRAADRALRRLSREARAIPAVRDTLRWCADHEVIEALGGSEAGAEFLDSLRAFLEDHGRRTSGRSLVADASWLEDPLPAIHLLREYALQPDRDVEAEAAALADERCRLEVEVRDRLKGVPSSLAGQLSALLEAARVAVQLREDRGYWIVQRAMFEVRRVMLELGMRLALAGVVEEPTDLLHLDLREAREAVETMPWVDQRPRIARRRLELDYCRGLTPQAALGAPPDTAADDEVARLLELAAGAS